VAKSKVKWTSAEHKALAQPATKKRPRTTIEVFQGREAKWAKLPKRAYKPTLWYFHLLAGNGEIIAVSEGYTRKYTATQGAKRVLAAQ
jgi:hypothetical protein